MPSTHTVELLNAAAAERLLALGVAHARRVGSPSNIAVVDAFGYLLAHLRMDGAQLPSIEHAIDKAYTSALFRQPTADLKAEAEPGGSLYGLNLTLRQRVLVFAGGMPLWRGQQLLGAIGVSGGTSDQDQAIAGAVAAEFQTDAGSAGAASSSTSPSE